MIKLLVQPSGKGHKVVFTPRPGFRAKAKEQECELLYGHTCPTCGNLIQAYFKTPQAVDLWPYEETVVLSQGEKNMGEIRKIFPDEKAKRGSSCYRSEFTNIGEGAQKIVLKNHIVRQRAIEERSGKWDGEGIWEVGERVCPWTGVFALREDLLIRDLMLFSTMGELEIMNYNVRKLTDLVSPSKTPGGYGQLFRLVPAVGKAQPVVLIDRNTLVRGYRYALINTLPRRTNPT